MAPQKETARSVSTSSAATVGSLRCNSWQSRTTTASSTSCEYMTSRSEILVMILPLSVSRTSPSSSTSAPSCSLRSKKRFVTMKSWWWEVLASETWWIHSSDTPMSRACDIWMARNSQDRILSLGTMPCWICLTTGRSVGVARPRWYSSSLCVDGFRSPR
ncbi:hypothetical protein VTK26DRAFT_5334 [Humicola hyalothermophila]